MAYLSLYRKYRSQSFNEVSGQDHVTRTLQNAIRSGKVAHAYLFCGPRGTGKTSTARLLAKALNCENGPIAEPCNQCSACTQLTEGRFLDFKEIDAASNRGIEDIRDLRDNVAYAPVQGRYKVYVIDEAHQITGDAFNAFLKTLEEPPPHVVFIMATTEAQKIPATIISRCQRFEFRRASLEQLRERVSYVAGQEGATLEPAALDLIAREANGGWRDALSLLEQVLAFCEGSVTARDVYTVLGTVEADVLHELGEQVHAGNGAEVFRLLDTLIAEGKDPRQLLRDLTQHFRSLMLAAAGSVTAADAEQAARVQAQSQLYGQGRLIAAIEVLAQTEREARWSENPRLLLELALVRLMHPQEAITVRRAAPRPDPVPQSRPAAGSPPAVPAPSRPVAASPESPPAPRAETPSIGEVTPGFQLPPPPLTLGDARAGDDGDDDDPLSMFDPGPPRRSGPASPEPPVRPATTWSQPAEQPRPAVPAPASSVPSVSSAAGGGRPGTPEDLDLIRRKWRLVSEELKRERKMTVHASLADTVPDRFEADVLVIRFPSDTMARMFMDRGKAFSQPLMDAIQRVAGIACRVRSEFVKGGKDAPPPASPARMEPAPSRAAVPSPPAEWGAPPPTLPGGEQMPPAPETAAGDPRPVRPASTSGDPNMLRNGPVPKLTHDVLEIFDGQIVHD